MRQVGYLCFPDEKIQARTHAHTHTHTHEQLEQKNLNKSGRDAWDHLENQTDRRGPPYNTIRRIWASQRH